MATLRLPGYDMQTNRGNIPVAQAQPVSQAGAAAAGNALLGISQQMQDAYDTEAFTKAQVDYLRGVNDLQTKYAESTDYQQNPTLFAEDVKNLRAQVLEPLNQRVGDKAGQWMSLKDVEVEASFQAANQKRYHAYKLSEFKPEQDALANAIVYAGDDQTRDDAAIAADMRWESMRPFYESDEAWANAREAWEDKVIFGSEMQGLIERDGEGWVPNSDLSPDKNRQLEMYAMTLQAKAVRNAEKMEAKAAAALEDQQEAYELDVMGWIQAGQKPDGTPYDIDDWTMDQQGSRLSVDGAGRVYRVLTGQGGPTNKEAFLDAEDTVAAYERGEITYEQAKDELRQHYRSGSLSQDDYKGMAGDLDREKDQFEQEADALINSIYQDTPGDFTDAYKEKRTNAKRKMMEIARTQGGQAALDYAKGLAKQELDQVRPPTGYTGDLNLQGLVSYREKLVARQTELASDDSAESQAEARKINRLVSETDAAIERLQTLKGVAQ